MFGKSMKKLQLSFTIALILLGIAASLVSAAGHDLSSGVLKDLAAVRRATAKYHDVDMAIADGYIPTEECVAEPGLGGMGMHFVNPGLIIDPAIELTEPEVLLYASYGGELRLVGVEYLLAIGPPGGEIPNPAPPAPMLFDRSFDGPMPPHEPGMPPHYDLHVWLWHPNPAGMFAGFNPNISCD